jgi:hypothetical protein
MYAGGASTTPTTHAETNLYATLGAKTGVSRFAFGIGSVPRHEINFDHF